MLSLKTPHYRSVGIGRPVSGATESVSRSDYGSKVSD